MITRIETGKTTSRAVIHNNLIYFSGHGAAGKQPTMAEQTRALLARYDELLARYGSDKDHLLSATIYITDMALKPEMNQAWNEWINEGCAPARVCIQAGLEEGYFIEISLIAEIINQQK